jgi:hypothetical protein
MADARKKDFFVGLLSNAIRGSQQGRDVLVQYRLQICIKCPEADLEKYKKEKTFRCNNCKCTDPTRRPRCPLFKW